MRRFNPRGALAAAALLALLQALAGCFGGASQDRSYYAIEYPRGESVQRYPTRSGSMKRRVVA